MNRVRALMCVVPLVATAACFETEEPGGGVSGSSNRTDGGADDEQGGGGSGNSGGSGSGSAGDDGEGCLATGTRVEVITTSVDKVDLVFVVDDSGSMREEQASLIEQFPRLIRVLTTGDRDEDGTPEFSPAKDLHLGVVSTDMGLVGVEEIPMCSGLGKDGVMQNTPSGGVGCQASYPRFLTYTAGVNNPIQTASDFACIAQLGTQGCGFEQQLEAGLKALWPSVDVDPETGEPLAQNRITFLGDAQGFGMLGHGDTANAGFLRNDPRTGLSLIAIVVVSDEEDCSSRNQDHFRLMTDASDPLSQQALNLRCFFNPQNLYPLERYIAGYRALRPGNPQLVMFHAIVGVPPDLVEASDYEMLGTEGWGTDATREPFYEQIQNDPRMQEVIDMSLPPEQGNLLPSCNTARGVAYPPRRIVEVARGFAEHGSVHSICQEDLGPAIEMIAGSIGAQLGAACLPRPLERGSNGLSRCNVIWELPAPGMAPASTPTRCGQPGFAFLTEPRSGSTVSDVGGARCVVEQLAVEDGAVQSGRGGVSGWYYDDFSEEAMQECRLGAQRVAFTPEAKPPTAVRVLLECPRESGAGCNGN